MEFDIDGAPHTWLFLSEDLIDFDAERAVLCEKKENKTTENYIFQYQHTPLYMQRFDALKKLAEVQKDSPAARQTLIDAMHDPAFYLRQFAIDELDLPKENKDSVLATIADLAQHDKVSEVRRSAILKLSKSTSASQYTSLFETAIGDSSYEVAGAALNTTP